MPTFQILAKPPQAPEDGARIFRLAPTRASPRAVLGRARRFGLAGRTKSGTLCQDARQTRYSEGSLEFVVYHASGGIRFHDNARWQVDDGSSRVEFDDATAIRMAERFIEAHDVVPLAECKLLRVTRLNVGVADRRSGLGEHRVIDVGVAFTRVVDGLPVEGPGGKVMVYIDHEGNLTGIDRLWRDLRDDAAERVALRPAEAVQREAMREWEGPGSGVMTIDDIRLGYYEHGWDTAQRYLQPAWVIGMSVNATEGVFAGRTAMRTDYWGAAAVKSPERLIPQREPLRRQPPREGYGA
ncbi:hypothetical protein D7V80_02315 [Corallococcus sp. CA054B]|uniref:hypothetical protein n=1 Tax=Corallococcus sp. CA054B TaxID=2316734 RepID=UPI000EA11258|nr:hypothetical protein [Corallococcus sp. CA054B]RKG71206.1 hypothetical protein D7V80_02315 [Corallococcus sp. CA054B]